MVVTTMIQHRHHIETTQSLTIELSSILDLEFEDEGIPISHYEVSEKKDIWGIAIYVLDNDSHNVKKRMEHALRSANCNAPIKTETIYPTDWVTKTLRQLSPVRAGRFLIHGSHDKKAVRFNDIGIEIDAGLAFGTGHHGTTAGCLEMLEDQLKSRKYYSALDLGTGSGILAIGFARATKLEILASDNDPVATEVARVNANLNSVGNLVTCVTSTGFNHNEIRNRAPYDLVIANILARPLQMMAKDFAHHLDHEATIILSGLLPHQKARIIAAYKIQGFRFIKAHIRDGWLTLVLRAQ